MTETTKIFGEKKQSKFARGLFMITYAMRSMRKNRRRSISLVIGFMISVTLFSSILFWTETGPTIALNKYLEENTYQFSTYPTEVDSVHSYNYLQNIKDGVESDPTVKSADLIIETKAFYNISWVSIGHFEYQTPYAYKIKDMAAYFVEPEFMDHVKHHFNYTGDFSFSEKGTMGYRDPVTGRFIYNNLEVLVSQRVIDDFKRIYNRTLAIGDTIDRLEVATSLMTGRYPSYYQYRLITLQNLVIKGIYSVKRENTVLYNSFPSLMRANYPFARPEEVLGLVDSIILPISIMSPSSKDKLARLTHPHFLIRADPKALLNSGYENSAAALEDLKVRLETNFKLYVSGYNVVEELQNSINQYMSAQTILLFLAPALILSFMITVSNSRTLAKTRKEEIGILRAKGTSQYQIIGIFLVEYVILSTIAFIFGIIGGGIAGCLIPASTSFLKFDITTFFNYLGSLTISNLSIFVTLLLTIIIPVLITFQDVWIFVRREIKANLQRLEKQEKDVKHRYVAIYMILVAIIGALFGHWVITSEVNPILRSVQTGFIILVWILVSAAGSISLRKFVERVAKALKRFLGVETLLIVASLERRKEKVVSLLVILTLTFSLGVFAIVETQTVQNNTYQQYAYDIGADFRITTYTTNYTFVEQLESINGISAATPLQMFPSVVAEQDLAVFGVESLKYLHIGYWYDTSFTKGDPETSLTALTDTQHPGIIINDKFAQENMLNIGDNITINLYLGKGSAIQKLVRVTVRGIIHSAPGLGVAAPTEEDINRSLQFQFQEQYAIMDFNYLWNTLNASKYKELDQFIASSDGTVSPTEVEKQIEQLLDTQRVYTPLTYTINKLPTDVNIFLSGLYGALSFEFLVGLAMSILAISVIMSAIIIERQKEYAIYRAIGARKHQIRKIVFGEFVGIVISAFIVGIFLGIVISWLLLAVLRTLFPFPTVLPFTIIIPWSMLSEIFLVILAINIGICLLPTRKATNVNITQVLREL